MVNAAVARYSVDLGEALTSATVEALDRAEWDVDKKRWDVRIGSVFLRERILTVAERLPLPDPTPGQRGPVWRFPDETYQAIRKEFGMDPRPVP